ncbi:MAG: helix-turn-helix domain-containing protein, partial [Thiobacillus sp.]
RRHAPAVDLTAPRVATGNVAETMRALLKQYGSRRAVAKKLGVTVPTLYRKLKQLGIINLGLMAVSLMAAAHFQQL